MGSIGYSQIKLLINRIKSEYYHIHLGLIHSIWKYRFEFVKIQSY